MSDYFNEIEGHFALRRGTPFILSAKDWVLMKKWHDDGVPLPVVLEAIDAVFEKNESSGRRKVISSLSYCRHAVKELWEERKELQAGEGGELLEAAPGLALEELAAAIESNEAGIVRDFAPRIRALAAEKTLPRIEERLAEAEKDLFEALLSSLSPSEREAIESDVTQMLGDTSKADEKTRARTKDAHLRRMVRTKFGIPRLTLFR